MKPNNIKEIWQSGINTDIKSYTDSELNELIVKSARKSMKTLQLGGIFQFIIIAVMIYLLFTLIFQDYVIEKKLLDLSALLLISVSFVIWKYSDYKMNKYKYDMPIKEWLKYRINELHKTIYRKSKQNRLILCVAFIVGFAFHLVNQIILKIPFNPFISGSIFVALIVYNVIISRIFNKKYKKALRELEELHKQIEE